MTDWVVINFKTGRWECHRCGGSVAAPDTPQLIDVYCGMLKAFADGHSKCEKPNGFNAATMIERFN